MEMTGEYRIEAPRERVWAALNDPEVLKDCIPGCKSLEKLSDEEMTAKVAVAIGPVKATMSGKVTLSAIDAPNGYILTGEGRGAAAGFAKGSSDVRLTEEDGATVLTYRASGQVGGKLAQVGARLVDAAAKDMADRFFAAFADRLAQGGTGADEASAEPDEEGAIARAEHAVEEAAHRVSEAAHDAEEAAEDAAARNVLGGPAMWGLLALAALVLVVILTR